jgi:hypothetical protein
MCFDTHRIATDSQNSKLKFFQSCHASRHNTRARFESATVFSPLKELSSLNKLSAPLSSVGADHTTESGLLLSI